MNSVTAARRRHRDRIAARSIYASVFDRRTKPDNINRAKMRSAAGEYADRWIAETKQVEGQVSETSITREALRLRRRKSKAPGELTRLYYGEAALLLEIRARRERRESRIERGLTWPPHRRTPRSI